MPKPDIKVTPLKDVVLCGTKEVTLTCSVQSPYKVRFEQDPTKGKKNDIKCLINRSHRNITKNVIFSCHQRVKQSLTRIQCLAV